MVLAALLGQLSIPKVKLAIRHLLCEIHDQSCITSLCKRKIATRY